MRMRSPLQDEGTVPASQPPSNDFWCAAMRSRAARLSAVSSSSFCASGAGPRRVETSLTVTIVSYGPCRTRTAAPALTSFERFAFSPFRDTLPPSMASTASDRVL